MILFKPEMVTLIETCRCTHTVQAHTFSGSCTVCACQQFQGKKTQTRRFWKRPRVKVGSVHNVNTSYSSFTGLRIRILRVWEQRLDFMSLEEVEAEGFEDWLSFMAYMNKLIGYRNTIVEGRRCYAVEFEVVT